MAPGLFHFSDHAGMAGHPFIPAWEQHMTEDATEVVEELEEAESEQEPEPVTGQEEPEEEPRKVGRDGFPLDTPVADMVPEEAAAYWKHQAKKHERTSKAFGQYSPAEVKAMASRLAEIEDSSKTEEQKLAERASAAEQRAVNAEGRYTRLMAAAANDLPPDLLDFISGSTEEEIEASAAALGAAMTAGIEAAIEPRVEAEVERRLAEQAEQNTGYFGRPVESLTPGGLPNSAEHRTDGNALLRRMAGRPGY